MSYGTWAIQIFDGEKLLPEEIVEAKKAYRAVEGYCDKYGLDADELQSLANCHWLGDKKPRVYQDEVYHVEPTIEW